MAQIAGREIGGPEPIGPQHDLEGFDCGVPALNDWLRRRALFNQIEDASRTCVIHARQQVLGYYSLAATAISHQAAIGRVRRNMPEPVPAILLGRLAVDRSLTGKGVGGYLLKDALLQAVEAAQTIGVRAVLVDAISQEAAAFYRRFGFRHSALHDSILMITVQEVRSRAAGKR